jgi:hypothetical protein
VDNMSYLFNDLVGFKATAIDGFGRLKTSEPFTLFDSQHRYQENDKWDTSTSGGGSKSYSSDQSVINMIVDGVSGSKVVRETKRVMAYQPGKSLLVLSTFVFASGQSNLRQRIGYFSTQNGIYLEQNNGTNYFVLRTYVTGTVDDSTYRVAQSSWNADTFDGNGSSGITIDFSKANIMWMDIEWLGVGDVRIGFVYEGRPVLAHTFRNPNLRTTTYMTTACLPLRAEIENTGNNFISSTLKHICNSVISEAGFEGFARKYNIEMGTTKRRLVSSGTLYPVMSIKINSSRLDSLIVPSDMDGIVISNQWVQYKILINATFGGTAPSYTTHSNGNVDYCIHDPATSVSGGTNIQSGYINNANSIELSNINNFNFQLGRTLAGVSDVLTLAMQSDSANTDIISSISWYEII